MEERNDTVAGVAVANADAAAAATGGAPVADAFGGGEPVAEGDASRASRQKLREVSDDEVKKMVDALTGATWGKRNRIMAGMFQRDLRTRAGSMPTFAPPGTDIEQGASGEDA